MKRPMPSSMLYIIISWNDMRIIKSVTLFYSPSVDISRTEDTGKAEIRGVPSW